MHTARKWESGHQDPHRIAATAHYSQGGYYYYYYYYETVHEVHNKNTQKDNKNMTMLTATIDHCNTIQLATRSLLFLHTKNTAGLVIVPNSAPG